MRGHRGEDILDRMAPRIAGYGARIACAGTSVRPDPDIATGLLRGHTLILRGDRCGPAW
jgi:hypothetical protein